MFKYKAGTIFTRAQRNYKINEMGLGGEDTWKK